MGTDWHLNDPAPKSSVCCSEPLGDLGQAWPEDGSPGRCSRVGRLLAVLAGHSHEHGLTSNGTGRGRAGWLAGSRRCLWRIAARSAPGPTGAGQGRRRLGGRQLTGWANAQGWPAVRWRLQSRTWPGMPVRSAGRAPSVALILRHSLLADLVVHIRQDRDFLPGCTSLTRPNASRRRHRPPTHPSKKVSISRPPGRRPASP